MLYSKKPIQKQVAENHQPVSGTHAARTLPAVPVLKKTVSEEEIPAQQKSSYTSLHIGPQSGPWHRSNFSFNEEVKPRYHSDKPASQQKSDGNNNMTISNSIVRKRVTPSRGITNRMPLHIGNFKKM